MFIAVKKVGTKVKVPLDMLEPIHKLTRYTNVTIEPRESIEAKELITLGMVRYFPEPGSYEIQATITSSDGKQSVESKPVTINIQEPTGADRPAYNLIRNSSFQEFLFSGSEFGSVKDTLETITALYPNSVYAKHASFVLGENYFYGKNYPQALLNLVRLENDANFIHAEKVRRYLTEIRKVNAIQTGTENSELKKPQ